MFDIVKLSLKPTYTIFSNSNSGPGAEAYMSTTGILKIKPIKSCNKI